MQPSESLYEQKPEELPAPVSSSTITKNNLPSGPPLTSRFEYTEDVQSSELNSGGSNVTGHVSVPKSSSSFFSDFGMDSGFQKKSGPSSSKVQVSLCLQLLPLHKLTSARGELTEFIHDLVQILIFSPSLMFLTKYNPLRKTVFANSGEITSIASILRKR